MPETTPTMRCECGLELNAATDAVCPGCGRRWASKAVTGKDTVVLPETGGAVPIEGLTDPQAERPSLAGQCLDHFRLLEELGKGGVGTVYRAIDTALERDVAIKVLNEEGESWTHEAFVHEARAQARVNHPGIATIYYIGRHGGIPYFAMEYVPGESLETRVNRGPLPPGEVIRIGLQAVKALREANRQGITHRDIKPGNFLRTPSGQIKLTDFGLSKSDRGGLHLTGTRMITGTPNYIAPEQARGESTDLRTDIYSLGAMLYHLAYGRPPFVGESFLAVISRHLSSALEFPPDAPGDIPVGFPRVISRMMAKAPGDRYADYDELEADLRLLLPEAQVVATLFRRFVASLLEFLGVFILSPLAEGLYDLAHTVVGAKASSEVDVAHFTALGCLTFLLAFQVLRFRGPGKEFAHIRIAAMNGRKPVRWRLAVRWLFQWLPIVGAGTDLALQNVLDVGLGWWALVITAFWAIDNLWALTNRRRRTLHDLIAGTWVLEDRPCA